MSWLNSNWQYRKKITIDKTKVSADLTDFPVYLDLANLGNDFHANVKSDGGDIRITKSNGTTEVPVEIVAIDTTSKTGEVHFKADGTLSSSADTEFYIYYGNSSATKPAVDATYGRNAVWSDYEVVLHGNNLTSSTLIDSTGNGYEFSKSGVGTTEVSGKVGKAQDFTDNGGYYLDTISSVSGAGNATKTMWLKREGTTSNVVIDAPGNFVGQRYFSYFHQYTSAGNYNRYTGVLALDTYEYIGVFFDGSQSTNETRMKVYQNGSAATYSSTVGTIGSVFGTATDFFLSYSQTSADYIGEIDEYRLALSTLSIERYQTEYNNMNSPSTFSTIGSQETDGNVIEASLNLSSSLIQEQEYSKGEYASLPIDNSVLSSLFTSSEYSDVSIVDNVYVGQNATNNYAVFLFKVKGENNTSNILSTWTGKTNLPPSHFPVYLQVYNLNSNSWETIDSDNSSAVDTNFTLQAVINTNLSDYYDINYNTYCRVYQLGG